MNWGKKCSDGIDLVLNICQTSSGRSNWENEYLVGKINVSEVNMVT